MREKKELEYLKNPRRCLNCSEIIIFEKRDNKYCGHSCSATMVNSSRDYTWGDKISESLIDYNNSNKRIPSKRVGNIRLYEIVCKCGNSFSNKRKEIKFCSTECRNKFRKNKNPSDKYMQYRTLSNFKFNLSDYPNEFDFSLIEKHGWYSPSNKKNNLNGVSRDHIFSVREGFEMDIDPNIISHPANCQLMVHNENISKNRRSDISYEDLLKRIEDFNQKYSISNLI